MLAGCLHARSQVRPPRSTSPTPRPVRDPLRALSTHPHRAPGRAPRRAPPRRAMGLSSGPHGIKTFVKTRFPSAVRDFPSLPSLVKATGHEPKHVAVLLDGNVMVNQVPVAVTDFDGYVKIFKNYIQSGLLAADHVFVVWDEPLHVPRTKLDEQRRRDLQRQRGAPILSEDLEAKFAPKTDDYNMETIERCNPHDLLANRLLVHASTTRCAVGP